MNKQTCDAYTEWMSLALDGMLGATQSRLLFAHVATCPACAETWEAMQAVSSVLRAAPVREPAPGFVRRFEARLAYQAERRRRTVVWALLGVGLFVLVLLALPSVLAALSLTGHLVLPYSIVSQIQITVSWLELVSDAILQAGWALVRYVCTGPAAPLCIALVAVAAGIIALWTRLLVGRLATQRVRR